MSESRNDPIRDPRRLETLRATGLLDLSPEAPFDRVTSLAAKVLRAPVALVALVDEDRVFFTSQFGLASPWAERREIPFSQSFCKQIVEKRSALIVADARQHPDFRQNKAVTDFNAVAYLGVPLALTSGEVIGSFCVIDVRPRNWTEDELRVLKQLGDCIISEVRLLMEVSNRKQAEQRLLASETRLRGILEASLDALISIDQRGAIVEFNSSAEKSFGVPREMALGQTLSSLIIPPDPRNTHEADLRQYLENGEVPAIGGRLEVEALRADGTRFPAELALSVAQITGRPWVTASLRDITDRREAEKRLKESERRFRRAFEDAAIGMALLDLEGHWVSVNHALREMLGFTEAELLAMDFRDITHPDDHGADFQVMERLLGGKIDSCILEKRYFHKQGHVIWVRLAGSIIRDDLGHPLHFVAQIEDITPRKRAEEEVRRFVSLVEHSSDYIGMANLDGKVTYLNPAGCALVGLKKQESFDGTRIPDYVSDESWDLVSNEAIPKALETGAWLGEISLKDLHTGKPIDGEASVFPISTSGSDQPLCIATVIRDTRARKNAERELLKARDELEIRVNERTAELAAANEQLRAEIADRIRIERELSESHEQFRTMAEAFPQLVWTTDLDGCCDYVNPRFVDYTGIPGDRALGRGCLELIHPDDHDLAAVCWSRSTGDLGCYELESRFRGNDGSYRWFMTRRVPIHDATGRIVRYLSAASDIDDRKHAQEKLKASEQRLWVLTEAMPQIIWTATPEGFCDYFNNQFFSYTGLAEQDPGFAWKQIVHPDDSERVTSQWIAALQETGRFDLEYRLLGADGLYRWFKVRAVPIRSEAGQILQWIGTCTDIDDQKQAEEALRQSEGLLDLRVRERTEELEVATDALRLSSVELEAACEAAFASTQAKASFLANMSHEVRTPMVAILGYADILLDPKLPQTDQDAALQGIRRNGSHLLQIINDILDLSKVEAGRIALDVIAYSPWQVALEVVSALEPRANELSVSLKLEATSPLPAVALIDPTRVRQVLMNLVSNAIKFSGSGAKVVLRMGMSRGESSEAKQLLLEVEDWGHGMTPDQMGQLFIAFQQADSSTTRRFGGTGLGLSISRRLVEVMEGTISVRSVPDQGSCFTVVLPITTHDAEETWIYPADLGTITTRDPKQDNPLVHPALSGRVLLVEDSPDNRRVLMYYLSRMGLNTETAENGRIGVEKALGGGFDVILMDMQMPELDGYGAASALRRSGFEVPIVALTAHAMTGDREKCYRAGCSGYLTKPVDVAALYEELAHHLTPQSGATAPEPPAPTRTADDPAGHAILSQFADDPALAALIREFVVGLDQKVAGFRSSLSRRDTGEIEKLAHQLKGVGGMYGYQCLTDTASLIEEAAKEGQDLELLDELVDEFNCQCAQISNGLKSSA